MSENMLTALRQRLAAGTHLILVSAEFKIAPEQYQPFVVTGQSDEGVWGETVEGIKRFLPIGCSTNHTTVEIDGDEFTVRLASVPQSGLRYRIQQREASSRGGD